MNKLTFRDWRAVLVLSSIMTLAIGFFISRFVGGQNMGRPQIVLTLAGIMAATVAWVLPRVIRRRERVLAGLEPEYPVPKPAAQQTKAEKEFAEYEQSKGFLLHMLVGFAMIGICIAFQVARGQVHL